MGKADPRLLPAASIAASTRFARGYGWLAARGGALRGASCCVVYAGMLAFGLNEFRKAPHGFIPQHDRGYLIVAAQLPPGASLARTDAVMRRVARSRWRRPACRRRDQHRRLLRRHLHQCAELGRDLRGARAVREARERSAQVGRRHPGRAVRQALPAIQEAFIIVVQPPPVQGIGNAGGFRMMVEDRAGRGPEALQGAVDAMMGARRADARAVAGVLAVRDLDAAALSRHRPHQGAAARHQHARRVHRAADLYRLVLRQRLQPVRPHLPRLGAGRQRRTGSIRRTC